jgi:predicted nucleotidyltransferase
MPDISQQLATHLANYPEIVLALLFGSQATGTAHSQSDIDLGILGKRRLSDTFKKELIESLALEFGRAIDLVDLYDAPEPITGQALKGKRLLGDNKTYANLMVRHVTNMADFMPLRQRILRERQQVWMG